MRSQLFAAAVGVGLFISSIGHAAPQCGQSHIVVPGDSLFEISRVAFGEGEFWPNVYEFRQNPVKIGNNPNNMQVGITLDLPPCAGQAAAEPPSTVIRQASITTSNSGGSASKFLPMIDVLTGSDYAPFTQLDYPGRGMATQLVEAAMEASDLENEYRIDFVNDWGSHLSLLLPRNKYDMGFPWLKPDCSDPRALPESMQVRCEYEWSEPIYTFAVAYFGPINDPNPPQSFEDLKGKIICRPAGWFTFDFAEHGLRDGETVTLSRPATVAECFDQLERGRVDYVSMNRFTGEKAVAAAGLKEFIAPVRSLVDPRSLYVVAYRDNAEAAFTWMAEFNKGLDRIRANGVWDEIVNWHLEKHRAGLVGG